MGVTLWIDTEADETIELGATMPCYAAFAEMERVAGKKEWARFDALSGVLSACEDQEDVPADWLAEVREQAAQFLEEYASHLKPDTQQLLKELAGDVKPLHESRETPVADAYHDGIAAIQETTERAVKRLLGLGDAAVNQTILFTQQEISVLALAISQGAALAAEAGKAEAEREIHKHTVEALLTEAELNREFT
jgi:hypothetical protein